MAEKETYFEAVGRRKTSTARVRIFPAKANTILVNDKKATDYFATEVQVATIKAPLSVLPDAKYKITVHVRGGGLSSQADAISLGIARALIKENTTLRGDLKSAGYLKRDPRMKERKKPGLKKARRAPQWSKR